LAAKLRLNIGKTDAAKQKGEKKKRKSANKDRTVAFYRNIYYFCLNLMVLFVSL